MPSGSTPPPTAMQATPAAWARFATPSAVLPNAVWASIRPSPVMTRSARASCASKSVASMTGRRRDAGRTSGTVLDRQQREPDAAGGAGTRRVAFAASGRELRARRPSGRCARRARRHGRAWRPSAARRSRPRRSVRGAGSMTSQATIDRDAIAGRGGAVGAGHRTLAPSASSRPRPAVGRRAAADPEDDVRDPASIAVRMSSPVPMRRGRDGSRSSGSDQRQAGGLGHLDDARGPSSSRASAPRSAARAGRGRRSSATPSRRPRRSPRACPRRRRRAGRAGSSSRPGPAPSRRPARARPGPTSASP